MKILRQGVWLKPEDWKAKVECTRCTTLLEVEAADLRYYAGSAGDQRDPFSGYPECVKVTCPLCKLDLVVGDVPQHTVAWVRRR